MSSSRLLVIAALAVAACHGAPRTTTPPPHNAAAAAEGPILDGPALLGFARERFPEAVAAGTLELDFGSAGVERDLGRELAVLGITTTAQLAAIVPPDYQDRGFGAIAASADPSTTVAGLVRDLLMIHDAHAYFTKAWDQAWTATSPDDFPAPAAYGVDFAEARALGVFDDAEPCEDDGGDPCAD